MAAFLLQNFLYRTPDFWRKVARGKFNPIDSARSLGALIRKSVSGKSPGDNVAQDPAAAPKPRGDGVVDGLVVAAPPSDPRPLPDRMAEGFQDFGGPVLLIISGNDLTAQEFVDAAESSPRWRRLMADARVVRHRLDPSDHTFSRREWRDQVTAWTDAWLGS